MRDMEKWKDKVELSLDNRQIFFLFFGLSVVGCFVFALGVMVGRRTVDGPGAGGEHDALALLERDDALAAAALDGPEPEEFEFKDGLAKPATEGLPETRDPAIPPRPEDEVKQEKAAAEAKAKAKAAEAKAAEAKVKEAKAAEAKAKEAKVKEIAKPKPVVKPAPKPAPKPVAKPAAKPVAKPVPAVIAKDDKATQPKPKSDTVMAAGDPATKQKPAVASNRSFTLQMKAFSKQEDADKLADKLRRNGHDVRVEAADVNGRTWHRVRVGLFGSWDDALAAKESFEKQEQIIAYVVRQ
ncbi:MAG: SPOR domain-containing protein [Myxococcales bacterium]|nr:SPOR domain-containing protein [Myxococcales bacterium]